MERTPRVMGRSSAGGAVLKKHIHNALYFMLGLFGLNTPSAMACVEMYLCVEGVGGESTSKQHTGCIDVLAWSWGMSNSGTLHLPDSTGGGKVAVQDISVTKWIDKSTPDLLLSVANGKSLPKAELFNYRCGVDGPTPYFHVTMEPVLITSLSTGGSGGEDRLTENVTLNFAKVQWCYTPPDSPGDICEGWDIPLNQPQ